MLSILGWIIFGLIVGVVAKLLMPGRDPGAWSSPSCWGLSGHWSAAVGAVGLYPPGHPTGFIMATIGAIVVLFVYPKLLCVTP